MGGYYIDTDGLPTLQNYEQALARWESTQPWKQMTGEYDKRPLDRNRRRAYHKAILKLEGGHIACRLHETDVITYNADGTIGVDPWSSVSTDKFFNAVCPAGMRSSFNNNHALWLYTWEGTNHYWNSGHAEGYNVTGGVLLRPGVKDVDRTQWVIVHGSRPWEKTVINRKKARQALQAENFYEFELFHRTANQLRPSEDTVNHMGGECLNYLRDRSLWKVLLPYKIAQVRYAIYRHYRVEDRIKVPYVTRAGMMKNVH